MRSPRSLIRPILVGIVAAMLSLILTSILQVALVRFVTPPWTVTMITHSVESKTLPRRRGRSLDALGEAGPRAVVASEDGRFFLHRGFDTQSICAATRAKMDGKGLRGASTITQQVAKNVFLWQERSWLRKGLEAWYALLLEWLVDKERILELYLTVAETGPNVYGLEAGARHHFDKPARDLTSSEAGRIAGILPNPAWSISGKSAWSRARWVGSNPAPFPEDGTFERTLTSFRDRDRGLIRCVLFGP